MWNSSLEDNFKHASFQVRKNIETREYEAPPMIEHTTCTKNIPFPETYIRRTDSEHQLIKDTAFAEVRDLKMFTTILTGVQKNNFINPFTKKVAVDRILRRRSEDLSEYVDCDAISSMSVSRLRSNSQNDTRKKVRQDWIAGDTFQDCIFEMDL